MLTLRPQPQRESAGEGWIGPAPWIVTSPPGPNALCAVVRDRRVLSPSYTRPYPLVVQRAQGSIVEDVDANRYLDFTAGIAVCSVGHCHPQVVQAVRRQSEKLMHICGSDFHYEPMIALAEKLARIAPGQGPKRVFLTNSGTEAVEAAIKLARYHTNRKALIAFDGAFHGRTMGSLSLSSSKARHRARFGPFLPMVELAPYGNLDALRGHVFQRRVAPDEVAAIFVEPILGEGGYILPPEGFLAGLRELCDQHGILLVLDEIQTGMGRTGKMFCCDHEGVAPDILLLAKGLGNGMPIGAVVARHDVMDWEPGAHGSTFGGNPVSCAAALATIDLIEKQMLDNVNRLSPIAQSKLERISGKHACIANARGRGLMLAIDVIRDVRTGEPDPRLRDRILNEAFGRGLLLLGCGDHAIRFIPPLCINRVQLEVGLDVFDEVVATVSD